MASRRSICGVLVAGVVALSIGLDAQQALDRKRVPPPGPPPDLRVPTWTRTTLSNGAELVVSEKHDLPLVSFSIAFMGGSSQFERADRAGLASVTAAMMSEGTKTRDGEALSNALQLLGTSVSTTIGSESGSMGFVSTSGKFEPTLEIMADMLLNSVFPADALERIRAQRLVALTQGRAQPNVIAGRVFPRVLFGTAHPYGRVASEESIKAMGRDEVVKFHAEYFQPGRALVTVVGDVTPASAKAAVEKALSAWAKGGTRPSFEYPDPPKPQKTTIYLVDRPGAAQSTVAIGQPGPPRTTPDYYAIQVMNTILGGMFQSRLNANIREEKGYSYGVSSSFAFGKGPGPFRTGGDIVGDKTDAALV
jgi:zinc protease